MKTTVDVTSQNYPEKKNDDYTCSCDFASDSWYAFHPGHHLVCQRQNLASKEFGFSSAFFLIGQFSQFVSAMFYSLKIIYYRFSNERFYHVVHIKHKKHRKKSIKR